MSAAISSLGLTLDVVAVALPAAARLREGAAGVALGGGASAAYLDFDGFVVAITGPGTPPMPNGVVTRSPSVAISAGAPARVERGVLIAGAERLRIAGAPVTEPTVARVPGGRAGDVASRSREILAECEIRPASAPAVLAGAMAASGLAVARSDGGAGGLVRLLEAIEQRDSHLAAEAADVLLGRGGGLTPEGDDIIAGAAAAVVAFGDAAGFTRRAEWLQALTPPDLRRRTGALSATLLELAVRGYVVEPLIAILDPRREPDEWRDALRRLLAVGHSTGRAWAAGCGAAGLMLTAN